MDFCLILFLSLHFLSILFLFTSFPLGWLFLLLFSVCLTYTSWFSYKVPPMKAFRVTSKIRNLTKHASILRLEIYMTIKYMHLSSYFS